MIIEAFGRFSDIADFSNQFAEKLSVGATSLDNSIIGGKWSQGNAIRFQAKYSSPLSGFRCYFINNYPGYSAGNGGHAYAQLYADINGIPGTLPQASGYVTDDHNFPNPSSGRGIFPLFTFRPQITLIAGRWYWIEIKNIDPSSVTNYFSMDYLYNPLKLNQVPTMSIWTNSSGGPYSLVPYLIPSPISLQYANGLSQGLGWIAVTTNPAGLQCGSEYGFPTALCI